MIDWAAKAKRAQAKIAAVGAPATLKRATKAYDRVTDTTTETSVDVAGAAVLSTSTITGDDGRTTVLLSATLNIEPRTGDKLVIGTITYAVTKTLTVAPGGVPLLWSAVLET